ncbi:MAG: aldo/keto reductase [Chloroflexota bacterium]
MLGTSGLSVGVIGMGTWRTFDVPPTSRHPVQVRQKVVDAAIERGTNFFDSSPMYGMAEEVLGLALGRWRKDVLIATKVWTSSAVEAQDQIRAAMRYFGGYVDLYQVHNLLRWQLHLPVLRSLQAEGRVGAVGVTDYRHSSFPELMELMENESIESIQIPYNAADRRAERDILPLAAARGVGVIAMSPFGSGALVRSSPSEKDLAWFAPFGVTTWAQILLKWVVSDPRVSVTIPATSDPGRAADNARAGTPPFFGPEERDRVSWLARGVV